MKCCGTKDCKIHWSHPIMCTRCRMQKCIKIMLASTLGQFSDEIREPVLPPPMFGSSSVPNKLKLVSLDKNLKSILFYFLKT